MSELLDFYQQQAVAGSSSISSTPHWIAQLQEKALAEFLRLGFPSKHHENWKYTTIDSFLQKRFVSQQPGNQNTIKTELENNPPVQHKIAFINGVVVGADELAAKLPAGVIVQPLAQAWLSHADKMTPYLGQILQTEHGFHALNMAMLQGGLFIYLPAGVSIDEPLLIAHWQDKASQAIHLRHIIVAEAGSCVSVIEDYNGDDAASYFTNTVTEIYAAARAKVTHYKIQRESKQAYHIGHLSVKQETGSQVDSHSFSIGGKLVRSDITINLHEPHAQCLMNGLYAPAEGQHIDHHTLVTHEVPDCLSEQDYKGILTGKSRAVFNGRVVVAKDAQHTVAKQQNKNLLLSANAEIDTKPQLEIFADDVICTHGATVGQLDEDALFYLAARGIEQAEASQFLIQAFAAENLRTIPNTELAGWLETLLNQQLR